MNDEFMVLRINRGARKLIRTLIIKKNIVSWFFMGQA